MDSSLKQRAVIEFLVKLGEVSPTKIHQKLLSLSIRKKPWLLPILDDGLCDSKTSKPASVTTPDLGGRWAHQLPQAVELVDQLTKQNRRIRVRNLAEKVGCSAGTIVKIVDQLNYRKMCAKWVPKLLTQQQKDSRREICSTLLRERRGAEENFFRGTVTGDESWIHHYQPETRRPSMEWTHPGSPAKKKVKTVSSPGKIMVTIFWDEDDILIVAFLKSGQIVNS